MANAWEGRSKATPLGYKIFIWLLTARGLRAAYGLLPFVTWWYRAFMPSATRPLQYLYEQRLGYSAAFTQRLKRQNLLQFGQSLLDKIALISNVPNQLNVIMENVETINDMIAGGNGGILLSAHLGNWEAAGHALQHFNWKVNVLMHDGEAEKIKDTLRDTTEKRSFSVIPIREDGSHIFEIRNALARNELICINADRFREGHRTFAIEFLGKEALFPAGPFIIASKLRTPVCFTYALKQNDFDYIYRAYDAKVYEGAGNIPAQMMLRDFVAVLEKETRDYPDQWYNYYPFWHEQHS